MWNLCASENEILNVLGSRYVKASKNIFFLLFFVDKKQLDNKREHSGTEQMSSNLKAQLEGVIKEKFKFSNDDDDDDFWLQIFGSIFYLSLFLSLSFILTRLNNPFQLLERGIDVQIQAAWSA